jgi:oligopeptide/dipeptide ABC transporter ATP-binding protein
MPHGAAAACRRENRPSGQMLAPGGRPMSEVLLRAEHIVKHFAAKRTPFTKGKPVVHAIDDISFEVRRGEVFSLVGESGCGKSTTARILLHLIEPTSGRIWFDGRDITDLRGEELRNIRKGIQMIFQDPYGSLNPRIRVRDIVSEPLRAHGMARGKELDAMVATLLGDVGLHPSHAGRYPHEFSGGQRQRIGIARALALHPKLVVCDEPISALDVSIQAQVLKLLKDLQKEFDLTYFFITHDLRVVRLMSDTVAVMYLGQIVERSSKDALFGETLHPYTQALLSSIPNPDPATRREKQILEGDLPDPMSPPAGCRFNTRCQYCMDRCRTEVPLWHEARPGHWVSCHLIQ